MADGHITVEIKLPRDVAAAVATVAKLAGVKPATVIKVMVAIEAARQRTASPEPKP